VQAAIVLGESGSLKIDGRKILNWIINKWNRLCGLVVRVPGYRFRDPEFDFRRCQIF
jgi:hypothetical protein